MSSAAGYMKSHVSAKELRFAVLLPPPHIKKSNENILEKATAAVKGAESVDDILLAVGKQGNYLSYSLLKYLIDHYCDVKLRKEMTGYVERIEEFRHDTRLEIFCEVCDDDTAENENGGFSPIITKHKLNLATDTLESVERFRRDFSDEIFLHDYYLKLGKIARGCVEITWLVPRKVVAYIQKLIKPSSPCMIKYHVSTLTIDGFIAYDSSTGMVV